MRKSVSLPFATGLTLAAALFAASPAMAEMVKMSATLEASQEVPPNDSAAKGTADITFDTETRKLDWTIEYSGLTGDATGAHFHGPAAAGANADVAVPIEDPKSGAKGSATLTEAQATDLMAGQYYVNIHTAAHAGGEIRGQVEKAM
ncbi:CHRD domain-containing protein [Mesorhizobium sp. LHD-90]|uniref:CHRD domain-containing protein n=1 Tax=Mesorhizobium sp. LHD-90 TaxID=3071414 RepID=UPI0027E0A678|nr:CHRD domain-containing protein [Mesorhizobium sp. LHD-90]MDQ6433413.1 CHRD domain-containing protein [Mesorhizobium sp. LHD-90]